MSLLHVPATPQDADFMISLLMAGARRGHFFPLFVQDRTRLRKFVRSTIELGIQDESGLRSQAMIAWQGTARVGITIVTETQRNDNSVELAAIAVKKSFQGAGYGSMLLDFLLQKWRPHRSIYARCFPNSEKLLQMLLRRGFVLISTTATGTRVLKCEQEPRPEHLMGPPIIRAA